MDFMSNYNIALF